MLLGLHRQASYVGALSCNTQYKLARPPQWCREFGTRFPSAILV